MSKKRAAEIFAIAVVPALLMCGCKKGLCTKACDEVEEETYIPADSCPPSYVIRINDSTYLNGCVIYRFHNR